MSSYQNQATNNRVVTIQLTDRLGVRVYQDCRPKCLETAQLQKGLVLLLDGKELIEEGVGFGVPVVKYQDKTFFARLSHLSTVATDSSRAISKTYLLDTVSRKTLPNGRYIDDGVYSFFRKNFSRVYERKKSLTPFLNTLMELRNKARIRTEFVRVKPRGAVTVNYRCEDSSVKVKVDFSQLNLVGCREVLVLNEQGSSTFQRYVDSSGNRFVGRRIGAWDAVAADKASLLSLSGDILFSLQKVRGASLFRGLEQTRNRFSWAGLSYSLQPTTGSFGYTIGLELKT